MALHSRAILLLCILGYASAQYSEVDVLPQRTGTTSKPRYQKLHNPRLANGAQLQPIGGSARPRRPIPLSRPRPVPTSDAPGLASFANARPRPVFISPLAVKAASIPAGAQERQQQENNQQDKQSQQQQRQQEKQLQQQSLIKPVSEEAEEEEEDVAQAIASLGAVSSFSPQSGNLVGGPLTPKPDLGLGQFRGASPSPPLARPAPLPEQNPPPVQYRPQKPYKLRKPVVEDVPEVRITARQHQQPQPPVRSPSKAPEIRDRYSESPRDNYSETRAKYPEPPRDGATRDKKPVAQIIRRWREDNPDGSITWGFENDDGSYKEELIGVDCITRGKYGYIDLDGFRREYTYETGIKCDEEQQEEERENGFVDYQENKLVLPNGKTIDLSSMGKKQARRPQPIYN
ncbi:probable serine/threonine-protein kinase DDB_G0281745 [Venturia canescens]|uniref:probable serine/threonine-protein kinase DDB_G0281745 n=1 Tax=Venturia canescens TaxID=32260 RepID=UPI001C9CB5D2|nr:probable serine/threonine-protein kinase DDB_G0281745 [Venturia canescens]